ncbi:MAG: DUF4465 domain-containing protein [Chitinophagales bacterium]|nr:DUF4465 domain-containing protein [Chitinophagaceae bacterium]MCB9066068.1 DUF4465 domain-containing protein [Chitinophagales bacterium]
MRKISTLIVALLVTSFANAQTVVATFDTITLPGTDTFYVNYSMPMQDVGYNDGLAHFECVYDTAWGGSWVRGFAPSNMTDSVTSGYFNQYSAKPAKGYNGSNNYMVAFCTDTVTIKIDRSKLAPNAYTWVSGFYITNSTYAYNSMRDGDGFAKKFGGVPNNDSDWFKLTVNAYVKGTHIGYKEFYLADFRDADSTKDYIVKDWQWFSLNDLGHMDSLKLSLTSSDTGSFGMNTPAYFCMDDFTVNIFYLSVNDAAKSQPAKVYPNPATDRLYIEPNDEMVKTVAVYDMSGKQVAVYNGDTKVEINTSNFATGTYVLQIVGDNGVATSRFVKR